MKRMDFVQMWKEATTKPLTYSDWQEMYCRVFVRDGKRCRICRATNVALICHCRVTAQGFHEQSAILLCERCYLFTQFCMYKRMQREALRMRRHRTGFIGLALVITIVLWRFLTRSRQERKSV